MNPNANRVSAILNAPKIGVFYDVDDYPVPVADIGSFVSNVRRAITNVGYTGTVSIKAYGTKEVPDESMRRLYDDAGITFVFNECKLDKLLMMVTDMCPWDAIARRAVGGRRSNGPANMLLISKDILSKEDQDEDVKHSGFIQYVHRLHCEGPNMLYVVPDDFQPQKLPFRPLFPQHPLFPEWEYVNCVWSWSGLMRADRPLDASWKIC